VHAPRAVTIYAHFVLDLFSFVEQGSRGFFKWSGVS
jgi:hypothetical protein